MWTHAKGGFYHDGRFATLPDVVDHYDLQLGLHLSAQEKERTGPVPGFALAAARARGLDDIATAGYSQRFGLGYVDYADNCKRTIKESGHWYAKTAAANKLA